MTRMTKQREAVIKVFEDAARPLSPAEIVDLAQDAAPNIGLSTVYRTLRWLEEHERIAPVRIPGEPDRYELSHIADTHHHHFHCIGCGRVYDLDDCPGRFKDMLPPGFTLTDHTVVLHGRCATCGPAAPEAESDHEKP